MKTWNSGDIKFAEVDTYDEVKSFDMNEFDIVLINQKVEGLMLYPTKIIFEMEVPSDLESYIAGFESSKRSSIRKRLRTTDEAFETLILNPIDQNNFDEWEEGYKNFISTLSEGHNYIHEGWLKENVNSHFGIFFKNKTTGKIEGGSLIKKFEKQPKLSMSFAWYSDLAKEVGASTALICKLIDYSINNKFELISFGQDTNVYGGHLSIGLEEFKTGWGAKAKPALKAEFKSVIVPEPTKHKFKFYYVSNDILKLYKSYE